jgi:hypothetical protein
MSMSEAQKEGHEDGRCAAIYEKRMKEKFRGSFPITLEHALEYSDSYACIETQEDVDVYNAAFRDSYGVMKRG